MTNEEKIKILLAFVEEQADDYGIWFVAKHITEDYLQMQIRLLHAMIEELFIHNTSLVKTQGFEAHTIVLNGGHTSKS